MQSADGAVHMLPALPKEWADGYITGIKARGGFEIKEVSWKDGKIKQLVILSHLGGNLRLRVHQPLQFYSGKKIEKSSGINPNPFYVIESIPEPLAGKNLAGGKTALKEIIEYDVMTEMNKVYTFISQ
ncbi:glycoside hydrolase family 95-like protein [Flavihumibacter fluminis]